MIKDEDCRQIAMKMTVKSKILGSGDDSSEAPFSSELSFAMTEASIESLDLLSPAGTPMKHWLSCFQRKSRAFEVEYYPKDFKTVEFPATPASPLIPEDSVMRFHDEEITYAEVESSEAIQEECDFDVQVVVSPFSAEVTLAESSSQPVATLIDDHVHEEYADPISSVDILLALAWVVLSLAVLQGYKIPFEQMEFAAVHVIHLLKGRISESAFEAAQMANAVTAEAVCAIIGSSCIA